MQKQVATILLMLFAIPALAVSTCTDIIEQMSSRQTGKTYPWMQFTWLQNVFGDAQTRTITEKRYEWGGYALIVRNGQVFDEVGKKPQKLKHYKFAPTLDQAIAALGKPKKESTTTLNEYRWACTDTSSTLNIVADAANQIVDSSYFYCSTLSEYGCKYGHLG